MGRRIRVEAKGRRVGGLVRATIENLGIPHQIVSTSVRQGGFTAWEIEPAGGAPPDPWIRISIAGSEFSGDDLWRRGGRSDEVIVIEQPRTTSIYDAYVQFSTIEGASYSPPIRSASSVDVARFIEDRIAQALAGQPSLVGGRDALIQSQLERLIGSLVDLADSNEALEAVVAEQRRVIADQDQVIRWMQIDKRDLTYEVDRLRRELQAVRTVLESEAAGGGINVHLVHGTAQTVREWLTTAAVVGTLVVAVLNSAGDVQNTCVELIEQLSNTPLADEP